MNILHELRWGFVVYWTQKVKSKEDRRWPLYAFYWWLTFDNYSKCYCCYVLATVNSFILDIGASYRKFVPGLVVWSQCYMIRVIISGHRFPCNNGEWQARFSADSYVGAVTFYDWYFSICIWKKEICELCNVIAFDLGARSILVTNVLVSHKPNHQF